MRVPRVHCGRQVAQPRVREWMHVCKITDAQDAFETRVFSIRFKDERVVSPLRVAKTAFVSIASSSCSRLPFGADRVARRFLQELNCGVHFRVQVQDVRDVAAGVTAPFQIIFELVHSKFNEPGPGETSDDVDSLVPEDPVFTVVSSQSVKIGTIAGNFHEYFPVSTNSHDHSNHRVARPIMPEIDAHEGGMRVRACAGLSRSHSIACTSASWTR